MNLISAKLFLITLRLYFIPFIIEQQISSSSEFCCFFLFKNIHLKKLRVSPSLLFFKAIFILNFKIHYIYLPLFTTL